MNGEKELKERELEERIQEIEEMWVEGTVTEDDVKRATDGFTLHKEYLYGRFGEASLFVYKRGGDRIYVVRNNVTGAYKLITDKWKEAEGLARQLANRYRMLNALFGG